MMLATLGNTVLRFFVRNEHSIKRPDKLTRCCSPVRHMLYIYIYIVYSIYRHILYRYCSLDDNVGNAIVGIYKMIFIFIKLENDNSNKQQRPLPHPTSAPGTALPAASLPRSVLPQADQFPASVSRICSVTAIKTVLWHCPDYIARASARALVLLRGRGSLPGQ